MKNAMLNQAAKLNKGRRNRRWWQTVVRSMAVMVVFCTTYALILPALTMEGTPVCGHEAHSHTDACYDNHTAVQFQCGLEEGTVVLHHHDSNCFDAQNVLVCTLPELTAHAHGEGCFAKAEEPSCAYVHVHSDACITTQRELICGKEEIQAHTHSESCAATETKLVCTLAEGDAHTHGEACYETVPVPCNIPESEGHTHSEACYTDVEVPCTKTTNEEHIHEDNCYQTELRCELEEYTPHTHEDGCYDAEGTLVCEKPVVIVHQHTESCRKEVSQPVLVCKQEEHTHTEACYKDETENNEGGYLCGMGEHTHVETCADPDGGWLCNIPEHTHEAACLVEDLDLTADVDIGRQWEAAAAVKITGDWAEDLLAVARSQLGYAESKKNVVLEGGKLKGYTLYGAKYGVPYGDWDAAFVSFCLEYAGVKNFHRDTNCAEWMKTLKQMQTFVPADAFVPEAGDLVFVDTDQDGTGDHMGIFVEEVPDSGQWKLLAGDTNNNCVEYETWNRAANILGGCALPENPMSEMERDQAKVVSDGISALPTAETARAELLARNKVLDRTGYDTYLNDLNARVAVVREGYDKLSDEQKLLVGDAAVLDQLEALCAETIWVQKPVLTEDSAAVKLLNAQTPATGEVGIGQTALFPFQVELISLTEDVYSEGRVKLEFVLPLTDEQAVFDLDAMPWLENSQTTVQTRRMGETETLCQVLTGYWHLKADDMDGHVIPGDFAQSAAVKVLNMGYNEQITVQISAAMEHSTWEGVCQTHQAEEKLTVTTPHVMVVEIATPEQEAMYQNLLAEYNALAEQELSEEARNAAAEALWNQISEAYGESKLTESAFTELSEKVMVLQYGNLNAIAEPCIGNSWMMLRDSGWFSEYSNSLAVAPQSVLFSAQASSVPVRAARSRSVSTPASASQIRQVGGGVDSADGAVYVSKTIAGTDVENVFDITLEVITQDVVNEVYQEPDMAVVIVLDISNTMNSAFPKGSSNTRYQAAMLAAEGFLDQFANKNLGASKVGFVAFNTDAHQIFPMSQCATSGQATALKNTMRSATGRIINQSNYAELHSRFTNIEAGLKRASDLLATVTNKHKYIVFLSDGFPTTYTSSGYNGYDPYDANGTRFYDSHEKYNGKNRPCIYGTSYSDEAAIRARTVAQTLKNNGTTIFSVGVDIGGQTVQQYVNQTTGKNWSVVDRRSAKYEIGDASSADAYKNWLGTKIGSGYYYDSTDTTGLTNAFNQIFETIVELNAQSSHLDWVATDPMPDMGVQELDAVEFIGFFNRSGQLTGDNLVGKSSEAADAENTASYDPDKATIHWDLKNSVYTSMAFGNTTNYRCSLTYRVRLKNENPGFVERNAYDTNDTTALTYRVIEQNGDQVTVSERRQVFFPIPQVEGYLGELSFRKVGSTGEAVSGATFTLTHDTANCGACRGDGNACVSLLPYTANSDENGTVSFTAIPSGHVYILEETVVPQGYQKNGNSYQVRIAYDKLTVTVKDKDGKDIPWKEFIENHTEYRLPNTGGSGIHLFTYGGLLCILTACVYYAYLKGRKRPKRSCESE